MHYRNPSLFSHFSPGFFLFSSSGEYAQQVKEERSTSQQRDSQKSTVSPADLILVAKSIFGFATSI